MVTVSQNSRDQSLCGAYSLEGADRNDSLLECTVQWENKDCGWSIHALPEEGHGRSRHWKDRAWLDWPGFSREVTVAGTHGTMWSMERDGVGSQGQDGNHGEICGYSKTLRKRCFVSWKWWYFFSKTVKRKLSNSWNTWYCLPNTYHFQQISMFCSFVSVQFSRSVCPTLWVPMDCSRPGFPVHHQLL